MTDLGISWGGSPWDLMLNISHPMSLTSTDPLPLDHSTCHSSAPGSTFLEPALPLLLHPLMPPTPCIHTSLFIGSPLGLPLKTSDSFENRTDSHPSNGFCIWPLKKCSFGLPSTGQEWVLPDHSSLLSSHGPLQPDFPLEMSPMPALCPLQTSEAIHQDLPEVPLRESDRTIRG